MLIYNEIHGANKLGAVTQGMAFWKAGKAFLEGPDRFEVGANGGRESKLDGGMVSYWEGERV